MVSNALMIFLPTRNQEGRTSRIEPEIGPTLGVEDAEIEHPKFDRTPLSEVDEPCRSVFKKVGQFIVTRFTEGSLGDLRPPPL